MLHKNLVAGEVHVAANWLYANAAARTGATGFMAGDVGKLAWQTDTNILYLLTATTPTWVAVGAPPALAQITDWPAGVSATEVGYLDGVTSAIQTQLGNKSETTHDHDLDYAALGHTHGGDYATLGHNHSGVYEPVQSAASQAEMETGTEAGVRSMSPLRVAQAIAALAAGGGGGGALNDLTDVVLTSPTNGQVLKFNGTNWVNGTDENSGGGGGSSGFEQHFLLMGA